MDNWESFLHLSLQGEHVLIPSIRLTSISGFITASLLSMTICIAERFITFSLDQKWGPRSLRRSRWRNAIWRTILYWIATFLRLCYMLVTMSFHLGLLLVVVTTLATAQFAIELHKSAGPRVNTNNPDAMAEPLLSERQYALTSVKTRQRSKSKPDDIFIHPTQSNLARADVAALELGLAGNTDRVHLNKYTHEEAGWEVGQGRDVARSLLGSSRKQSPHHHPFDVGEDSDSDPSES